MDAGDSLPDAADHPVQDIQWTELGGNGNVDGTEVYSRKCKNGVPKIYGRKIMFVRFVHTVHFRNAIVYAERSE